MAASWPLAAQTPGAAPAVHETRELVDVLPAGVKTSQFVLTPDGQRTFFLIDTGEVWAYDHARRTSARVAIGPLWDCPSHPGATLSRTRKAERSAAISSCGRSRLIRRRAGARRRASAQRQSGRRPVHFARRHARRLRARRCLRHGSEHRHRAGRRGAEKIVAATLPSSVANIRWTPDGKTLYIGVNAPVACVPEWSCLPLATADLRQPPGSIRRVSVSGGAVTQVAMARAAMPGLSPDGTTMLFQDGATIQPGPAANARRWVVTGADGAVRDTLMLPATQSPLGWLSGSTVLIATTERNQPPRLLTIDLSVPRAR